jgi:hypothetical protein
VEHPLYDDPTLWVIPGSHRRLNTPEEERQLREDPRQTLPGGIPVELKAGDGVVYTNLLLHWGSFYTPRRLRRTFHFGYRSFGGPMWPYFPLRYWGLEFTQDLSPSARSSFEQFAAWHATELEDVAATLRAAVEKNASAFEAGLRKLHPGERGRVVALTLLDRMVQRLGAYADPSFASRPRREQASAVGGGGVHLAQFSTSPAALLQLRSAPCSALRKSTAGGASGPPTSTRCPSTQSASDAIASW